MGHWGHFFKDSLRKAEEAQGHDLMAVLGEGQHSMQNATNTTKSGPADLIVYTQPTYGDKWKASATNFNMSHGWDTFIMVSPPRVWLPNAPAAAESCSSVLIHSRRCQRTAAPSHCLAALHATSTAACCQPICLPVADRGRPCMRLGLCWQQAMP